MDNSSLTSDASVHAGDLLRQGRLKQRLSISECAKKTHIAQRFLEALEDSRWHDLPSESHRQGFIRLYTRFLGLSTDEVMALYEADLREGGSSKLAGHPQAQAPKKLVIERRFKDFYPQSAGQLVGFFIVVLILIWSIYHVFSSGLKEPQSFSWSRSRQPPKTARLTVTKPVTTEQVIRVIAVQQGWMRVTTERRLVYEGILPKGAERTWSGAGPFQLKFGNAAGVQVFWNDQPVDVLTQARGGVSAIQIPLPNQ